MTEADDSVDVGTSPDELDLPSSTTPATAANRSRLWVTLTVAAVVIVLDQLTKRWALHALADGRPRHVLWTLQLNLTFNSGMAFSRGQGIGPYIGAIALVVVVILLMSLRRRSSGLLTAIAIGLVVGGAIGNLLDRFFREDGWLHGRVVDFIDFQWFPIFNVADMGVTIGGCLLLLAAVLDSKAVST